MFKSFLFFINSALEPHITDVPPSDPVCPGDSVILQCSIPEPENNTRPKENSLCFLKSGSNESHPSFNCTQDITFGYEKNPDGYSVKKCVFSFFKNISCSDAGTFYCSVATTEKIKSENRSKLNNEGNSHFFFVIVSVKIFVLD